ncbi:hypothetical protein HS088_TW06G01087 [Tripterygium wilfordii]|uniref:Small ribosomal subunit protein mS38 n=1 Tax=Tripterygium wilfordii TaxID=458696 RepID=A0A7J7DKQ1_TRIWF|nr:uncharacterized protein LOC119999732 [Tripterygium wilfordii]KAF5746911.1 hypothetical protein HS088_TW06G01087 [Tripterygium wilfordii]
MASTLPKLFRRSVDARLIASLLDSQFPKLIPSLTVRPQIHLGAKIGYRDTSNDRPFLGLPKADALTHVQSSLFYPSFLYGFCLNPISLNGFIESEGNEEVSSDSGAVWADSVKKKRKKKMNKHKYQKLRKRIGRQT